MGCHICNAVMLLGSQTVDDKKVCSDRCVDIYTVRKEALANLEVADPSQGLILNGAQNKSVVIKDGVIRIIKQGGLFSSQREKALPIKNISSVEVKKPGSLAGFIQFSIAGSQSLNSSYKFSGGAFDAAGDENSVLFGGEVAYQMALKMKQYIENYTDAPTVITASAQPISAADEIRKLKQLLDEGILVVPWKS